MLAPVRPRPSPILLSYQPPFDWPATLAYLAARATLGTDTVEADSYWRTVQIDGCVGVIRVSHVAARHSLRVRYSTSLAPVRARVRTSVGRLFDLATDPGPISAHLVS